ncbi:MAG: hypothetical protein QM640_03260 [Niabella sp.]
MVALTGTFINGYVKFDKEYKSKKPVKVIVTFLEKIEMSAGQHIFFSDFSFAESREVLKDYQGSLADALIEERRASL